MKFKGIFVVSFHAQYEPEGKDTQILSCDQKLDDVLVQADPNLLHDTAKLVRVAVLKTLLEANSETTLEKVST